MEVKIFQEYKELCTVTAEEIADIVRSNPKALLCLAAGHTSLGVFDEMVAMQGNREVSFEECTFVGLDEWAGLGLGDDGSCLGFVKKHLFDRLGIKEDKIIFYDGKGNLDLECIRVDSFLEENGPLDYVMLGMGMNGHLGLNEPGTSFHLYSHVVKLDDTTKTVGQKYFKDDTELSGGITMGMNHFKEAKRVVLTINGAKKADIVKRLLDSVPSEGLPASFVKTLDSASLYLDQEAAGKY